MINDKKEHYNNAPFGGGDVILIVVIGWLFLGLVAFLMSLICFGGSGSFGEKVVGFFLAFFFGPFYWIYYMANRNYCR